MNRKALVTRTEEINKVVWEWFTSARSKNIHISGPMAQNEALVVAKSLGYYQFKASAGCLNNFKKRHNIVWNGVKKIKAETVKSILLKLHLGKVMWQIIWRRRVKTCCNI
jgi:hypothetical protein